MGAEKIENQNRQKSILVEFGFWSLSKRRWLSNSEVEKVLRKMQKW